MAKHYVRLVSSNRIIKGFSTDFEEPRETDICINEDGGRHFYLNGIINPIFVNNDGTHIYKYTDNEIVETTETERESEKESFPKDEPSQEELQIAYNIDLDYRLSKLEMGV